MDFFFSSMSDPETNVDFEQDDYRRTWPAVCSQARAQTGAASDATNMTDYGPGPVGDLSIPSHLECLFSWNS